MWNLVKSLDINTIILLLILMMMFGEYSQRYYKKANWGNNWRMEAIAPIVYYLSGIAAIALCVLLVIYVVAGILHIIGG